MAKESVKDLDPELKKIAFENILNRLLDEEYGETTTKKGKTKLKSRTKKKKTKATTKKSAEPDEYEIITNKIMQGLNTTKYPVMFNLNKTLDRSLYLLKIVREDLDIDGLIPSQIGDILTEKFRIKTTPNAIGMALIKALKYVDRRPVTTGGGSGFTYHIMHDGENYLKPIVEKASEK